MRRLVTIILAFAALTGSAPAARDCLTPIFADWSLYMLDYTDGLPCEEQEPFAYTPCADFTHIPHPGGLHGYPPEHIYTTWLYDRLTAAGAPRGGLPAHGHLNQASAARRCAGKLSSFA